MSSVVLLVCQFKQKILTLLISATSQVSIIVLNYTWQGMSNTLPVRGTDTSLKDGLLTAERIVSESDEN